MNPMRATIAILMALLIQPAFPQEAAESESFTATKQKAALGFAIAQFNLGHAYYWGEGLPQDYKAAIRWWRIAADQGNAFPQISLGGMYDQGKGVPKDYVLAHMWYNLAASDLTGLSNLQKDVELRDQLRFVEKQMTRQQVTEAQRLSREFKPKGSGSQ